MNIITEAEKETNLALVSNIKNKSEKNLNVFMVSIGTRANTHIVFEKNLLNTKNLIY